MQKENENLFNEENEVNPDYAWLVKELLGDDKRAVDITPKQPTDDSD